MSSFLGQPVDIPCRSFVDLKSNKSSMKLIEFLNQSSLVLLNWEGSQVTPQVN